MANDPAMCGFVEARRRHRGAPIIVVSVGTGTNEAPIAYDNAKDWGLVGWGFQVLEMVWNGSTEVTDQQLRELLSEFPDGPRYYRLQPSLADVSSKMDDASAEHIEALERVAATFVRDNDAAIQQACDRLLQHSAGGKKQ